MSAEKYIYHYYCKVRFPKVTSCPVYEVRKEPYTVQGRSPNSIRYLVKTKSEKRTVTSANLDTVIDGQSIYMLARNDDKARRLFNKYFDKCIAEEELKLQKVKNNREVFRNVKLVSNIED